MTPTAVDDLMFSWNEGTEKGFKYTDPDLFGVEWLVIIKQSDNLYEVIEKRSSTKAGPFNKDRMQKLLGSNKLELYSSTWGIDFKYKKSNGCECGAWATRNPTCHSWTCPKARNY
jgi:hypothetical protein